MRKHDTRVKLKKGFQRKLFSKAIEKCSSLKLCEILNISRGMIYHYRNYRVKSIPLKHIKILKDLLNLTSKEVSKNTIKTYSEKESALKILKEGRNKRKLQLTKMKKEISDISLVFQKGFLDLEKWFKSYRKLIETGPRKITSYKVIENKIILEYLNFSKGKRKEFVTVLPKKMKIDQTFLYFFGLWLGDKAGGGRFGIMNKNEKINRLVEEILENKFYQKVKRELYIGEKARIPKIKCDKITKIKGKTNGYAIGVYSVNSILKRFFEYLEENIEKIMKKTDKNIIFAGLFDAEGNILLRDKCYRWSCKNMELVKIYKKYLDEMGLFRRYDGSNLVGYNLKQFEKLIYPYIQHPAKINSFNILKYKEGKFPEMYKEILAIVDDNPGFTCKEISKALKKAKVYPQIRLLEEHRLVESAGYPKKMFITNKGLVELAREART